MGCKQTTKYNFLTFSELSKISIVLFHLSAEKKSNVPVILWDIATVKR